jgi:hypothetical protein
VRGGWGRKRTIGGRRDSHRPPGGKGGGNRAARRHLGGDRVQIHKSSSQVLAAKERKERKDHPFRLHFFAIYAFFRG